MPQPDDALLFTTYTPADFEPETAWDWLLTHPLHGDVDRELRP